MDDLISRRDAVSRFSDLLMIELRGKRLPTWEEVYNAIKEVPSAQRNGKWIYPTDIKGFGRCPHCKALWDYSLISNPFFKFCPRCGNGENELTELKGEEDVRESD